MTKNSDIDSNQHWWYWSLWNNLMMKLHRELKYQKFKNEIEMINLQPLKVRIRKNIFEFWLIGMLLYDSYKYAFLSYDELIN